MAADNYLKSELYELIQSDERLIDFIEQGSLDGLWFWDLESPENEWMSPRFWATLGIDPETKKHQSSEWQHLIHPEDLATALTNFERHCKDPNHKYDQYVRYRHSNGKWVWVRCRGLAIRDTSGKPIRMLGAHTDVTEIMEARETEQWAKKLEAMNEDLVSMSYALSHDLRAPLKSLEGLFAILKEETPENSPEVIATTMALIDKKLTHVHSLLDSVRSLADLDGRSGSVTEGASLAHTVNSVISELNLESETLATPCAKQLASYQLLGCHPVHLYRILLNIFHNSVKFAHPDRPLRIEVSQADKGEFAEISVKDNGIGLESRQANKIFANFSRFHKSGALSGSGLGLAIARKIVAAYGGEICAESEKDSGLKISFTLPLFHKD
ncbi:PAS domain-containing sensor histidine kinase [Simiduia sp. 21SJ11W-1]|uniref:sensor histidine kinase n=1 Tax=Simiduia sp. 21SJ11W-1 TaxID=2909669 RepID=UPI00209E4724|nr:PAS domain-containing sensor histidine kinase [Simiduia sp. 21SJ11W-1]UTA49563.1 PAS domain-containing sensor histidine kinase [Simiduia sp. 21SJ11W-1]